MGTYYTHTYLFDIYQLQCVATIILLFKWLTFYKSQYVVICIPNAIVCHWSIPLHCPVIIILLVGLVTRSYIAVPLSVRWPTN